MNSLEYIKNLYKPYRITKLKNATIIDSSEGKFVLKKENKDLYSLFNYLQKRGFTGFPKLIKNFRDEENLFEFVEDEPIFTEQKLLELSSVIASLHNKTVYFKNSKLDDYKEIYENIDNNISYLKTVYNSLFLKYLSYEYQSPPQYLFCRNYSKYNVALNFCKERLDVWYEKVKDQEKVRVSVVHNNLEMDHFMYSERGPALISWDNYKIDTPVLDFVNLFHNEYLTCDFSPYLENYLSTFELNDDEKDLLFILLNIPLNLKKSDNIQKNTINIHNNILYLLKAEKLTKEYYSNNSDNK